MTNEASLLNQVINIDKKYEEIARITGDSFNIFQILKLDSKETSLHSLFLAELLNPQGNHGLANKFLELFIGQMPNGEIDSFDTANITVNIEKYIGDIDKDYTMGGRIDLLIENDQNEAIIIENKIYAVDQINQIYRYHRYASKYNKFHLLYLTLDGRCPDDNTTKTNEVKFKCKSISYKTTIINWLDACKQEAVNYPLLRETITQYINLLKHLTNQSTNKKMSTEIQNEIIRNEDAVKAAGAIRESLNNLENESDRKTGIIYDAIKKVENEFYLNGIDKDSLEISTYKESSKEELTINVSIYPKLEQRKVVLTAFILWKDFKWQAYLLKGPRSSELSELSKTICDHAVKFDIKTSNDEMKENLTIWIKEFIEKAK